MKAAGSVAVQHGASCPRLPKALPSMAVCKVRVVLCVCRVARRQEVAGGRLQAGGCLAAYRAQTQPATGVTMHRNEGYGRWRQRQGPPPGMVSLSLNSLLALKSWRLLLPHAAMPAMLPLYQSPRGSPSFCWSGVISLPPSRRWGGKVAARSVARTREMAPRPPVASRVPGAQCTLWWWCQW